MRLAQLRGVHGPPADAGLPRLFELESEYEQRVMEAELDFVRTLIKDIEDGSLDGIDMWRSFDQPEHPGRHTLVGGARLESLETARGRVFVHTAPGP